MKKLTLYFKVKVDSLAQIAPELLRELEQVMIKANQVKYAAGIRYEPTITVTRRKFEETP